MIRTFAASADADGIVHDPATGLTHRHPITTGVGRVRLDDADLPSWPIVAAADLARPVPVSVCWSPIVRCNLACPHCLDDTTVVEATDRARSVIAHLLGTAGILGVDISGGEPLLLRNLPDLGHAITATGSTAVSVTTNGWSLHHRAEDLVDAVDAVRVSLDGPTAKDHDHHRGAGSFTRATAGIRAAVAAGLPVQLQFVLMRTNQQHLPAMIDLAVQLHTGGLTVLQMLPIGAGSHLAAEQMLTDDEAVELVTALDTLHGFRLRLRRRLSDAAGFTVVRADGRIWRNTTDGTSITSLRPLTSVTDLAVDGTR